MLSDYYKDNESDKIWWRGDPDYQDDEILFSFDREKDYNLFLDYPYKLTREEKRIFDQENLFWADFFKDRK
ncbi:MAG: hypothetical protein LUD72_11215 [Bacteroidales bacterium]|nr:hypothetical protein [Bacteroidales bacterium]